MTCRLEDDIVQRALIAILMPSTVVEQLSKAEQYVPKKKCRLTKRPPPDSLEPAQLEAPPARISIVEQRTPHTLSICWSDPRSGYYSDQVWRIGLARTASVCVLTGSPIRRGDPVFRPRACERHFPANHNRMILASAVPTHRDSLAAA